MSNQIEARRGRPSKGVNVGHLILAPALLDLIDRKAATANLTRMEWVRRLIETTLRGRSESVSLTTHQINCVLSLFDQAGIDEDDPRWQGLRQVEEKLIRARAIIRTTS